MSDASKMMQYEANKKSASTAYLLCIFLGAIGVHRFYLDKKGTGAIMLLCGLTIIGLIISGLWAFLDLFRISSMVEKHNNELARDLGAL